MRFARTALPILFMLAAFALPVAASASLLPTEIIPAACHCDTEQLGYESAPDFGCVLQTVQNLMNASVMVGFLVLTLALAYGGFMWMINSVNPEGKEKARAAITNAIVGILIVLSAWLIVDFIMKQLYNPATPDGSGHQFGPWNEILYAKAGTQCIQSKIPTAGTASNGGGQISAGTGGSCTNCVSLSNLGLTCKSSTSCTLASSVAQRFANIHFSGDWRVTEAYPPTVQHQASCTRDGTCIDAGFVGNTGYTGANIKAFSDAAQAAGLCVVFETDNSSYYQAAREQSVVAHSKTESPYGSITGTHFSVYSRTSDCH